MRIDISKMKEIVTVAKNIISSRKKVEKLDSVYLDKQSSQKRIEASRNKAETEMEYIEDMMHELHCLAVEIGIAEKDPDRYGEFQITSSNGWATLKKNRREPKT